MAETNGPQDKIILAHPAEAPVVALTRIKRIDTYEVMDSDLDALDQIVAEESRSLAFASMGLGVFSSTLIPWIVSPPAETAARAWATYVGVVGISGVVTVWFGLMWNQARKRRPRLLERIRKTTMTGS